ncbi:MAG: D-tyrosyl-tRNA(Tyr) deacylase [Proteobacteria bacterium]|nr:MAG: D-tyrosyl-tRNA(Tyr) deacylase [Pseudomonadota bacterium]
MKALIQRVSQASVSVNGQIVGAINRGYLVLLGVAEGDQDEDGKFLAEKIANLRLFPNDEGKFDKSLVDIAGSILLVSQFTLLGDASKGRRPNFQKAARPEEATRLYERMQAEFKKLGVKYETGMFGAHMEVTLVNDGPVTLMIESR